MGDDFLTIEDFIKNNSDNLQKLIREDKILRWCFVLITLSFSVFFILTAETITQAIAIPILLSIMAAVLYCCLWRKLSFLPRCKYFQEKKYITIEGGTPIIIENYDGIIKIPEKKCIVIESGSLVYGHNLEQIEKMENGRNLLVYNDIFVKVNGSIVVYPSKSFSEDNLPGVKIIG